MSEDVQPGPTAGAGAISEEQLRKAEAYVEAEEGVTNRLSGWAGTIVTAIAVAMSLFHLYTAVAGAWPFSAFPIIATQPLRYAHVAFVLVLSFLVFPFAKGLRNRIRWWDVVAGWSPPRSCSTPSRAARTSPTARPCRPRSTSCSASSSSLCCSRRRGAPPGRSCRSSRSPSSPTRSPAPICRRRGRIAATTSSALVGHLFITLEGIFGIPVDVSSSLIILFTIFGAFLQQSGAGKFFIDYLDDADGQQAQQRRPHGGAVVVPARRAVRLGRRHHRDDRRRRLSDDAEGRLREERRRRPAGGRRTGRHHLAAGARRGRVPDRRVPQDQLSRRHLDGDHPDLPVLPVAPVHGRARRPALRRLRRRLRAGDVAVAADAALRLPLHLAGRRSSSSCCGAIRRPCRCSGRRS